MINNPQDMLQTSRQRQEIEPRAQLRIPKPIDIVQLQTTASTIYTASDNADFEIAGLFVTNVTNGNGSVTIYMVPSGGSPGAANTIVYQRAINAKTMVTIFNVETVGLLPPGYTLQALCGTNDAINIWGHGYDYQGAYS